MRLGLLALALLLAMDWPPAEVAGPTAVDAACGDCHHLEAAQQAASRHRVAWTSLIYQEERARSLDPPFCDGCHAPLGSSDEARHAGVSCAACHPLDGPLGEAHPTDAPRDPEAGCVACHDFDAPPRARTPGAAMQSTARERDALGLSDSCLTCHMRDGDHLMSGAHDAATLRGAIEVDLSRDRRELVFHLSVHDVGHAVPTGDQFRHLTLELQDPSGAWRTIAWLGRVQVQVPGELALRTTLDTRLWPGHPQEVRAPGPATAWRLRYHLAPDDSPLPEAVRVGLVAEGAIGPT